MSSILDDLGPVAKRLREIEVEKNRRVTGDLVHQSSEERYTSEFESTDDYLGALAKYIWQHNKQVTYDDDHNATQMMDDFINLFRLVNPLPPGHDAEFTVTEFYSTMFWQTPHFYVTIWISDEDGDSLSSRQVAMEWA